MSFSNASKQYFDKCAERYRRRTASLPWSWLRKLECDAIRRHLPESLSDCHAMDIGCGAGFYTSLLLELGASRVVAADMSQPMLDQINDGRVEKWAGDASVDDLPVGSDYILSAGLLEFVSDPLAVLKNVRRVVSLGAEFIVLIPEHNWKGKLYRKFHRRHGVAIKLFTMSGFQKICVAADWKVLSNIRVGPFSMVFHLTAGSDGS